MRSFVKLKPSQKGKITLSFTDILISCTSREFLTSQKCLLMQFAKIKFSGKFPNLQYIISTNLERSGSVVECLTRDRGAAGSSLTGVTALWSLSKTHLS